MITADFLVIACVVVDYKILVFGLGSLHLSLCTLDLRQLKVVNSS